MLVEKGAVERNQCLPLLVVEFVGRVVLLALGIVNLDTFALHHDEAGVDALNFSYELFLGYGPGFRLLDQLHGLVSVYRGGSAGRRLPGRLGSGSSGRYTEPLEAGNIRPLKGTGVRRDGVIVWGPQLSALGLGASELFNIMVTSLGTLWRGGASRRRGLPLDAWTGALLSDGRLWFGVRSCVSASTPGLLC